MIFRRDRVAVEGDLRAVAAERILRAGDQAVLKGTHLPRRAVDDPAADEPARPAAPAEALKAVVHAVAVEIGRIDEVVVAAGGGAAGIADRPIGRRWDPDRSWRSSCRLLQL